MSVTLKPIGDCCEPCESPLVVNTPGPAGAAGANGADGTDGENAFTETTANFTQPAVGANVTVSVTSSEWMVVGQEIFIEAGGYYLVVSKPTSASATVTNRGYDANAAPTVIIASGSNVSPAGEKGEPGTNGSDATVPLTTKGDVLGFDSATARIPVGTDGKVLAADSAQTLGVNYVTVQPNTATDNGIARYDGTGGKPVPLQDSKVVITDDGAIQTSGTGGNARGSRAVDLQTVRAADTQVASGADSTISGGRSNVASGAQSTVCGGELSIASGLRSVAGGYVGQATGSYSVCIGGSGSVASGEFSSIVGGYLGAAELYGQVAHASGRFENNGDAQASSLVWRHTTTDATPTELFLDGASQRAILRDAFAWAFRIIVVGHDDTGLTAAWEITGAIHRLGATTALVSAVNATLLAADAGSISDGWGLLANVAVTADNTNESLKIAVTGAAGSNIRWVAHARLVEVSW